LNHLFHGSTNPAGLVLLLIVGLLSGCATSGVLQDGSPPEDASPEPGDARAPEQADTTTEFQTGDVREINIPGTEVNFQLVFVSGGTYRVGTPDSENGREEDEGPRVEVTLSDYWIGRFEVTDTEYSVFRYPERDADTTAVAGVSYHVDAISRPSPPYEDPAFGLGGPRKPAVGMTQWGALHYARWLSQKTGIFFRLPTESEWETACRAGSETAYFFGDDAAAIGDYAWLMDNSGNELHNVGTKRSNAWDIHDMHGNVSEWMMDEYVADYHSRLAESSDPDPWIGPTKLHPRTVRGGAYDDPSEAARCGARLESTTNWKRRDPQIPKSFWWNTDSPFLGFRLLAPANPPSEEAAADFWTLVLGE